MKNLKTFFLTIFFLGSVICSAQTTLTGTVYNSKEKPLSRVVVYADSIDTKVRTNRKGEFKVTLHDSVSLVHVFSREYGLLSANYRKDSIMNFVFIDNKIKKEKRIKSKEGIGIAYSDEEKKFVAYAVNDFDAEKEQDIRIYNNIYDMIRGRVAGVTVTKNNRILIRGINSVRNTSDPLFVVDGIVISDIDYILPNTVKDIVVLKDAAASIYGSQGSAGVIKITTKK